MKAKTLLTNYSYSTFHGLLTSLAMVCSFLMIKNLVFEHIGFFRVFNVIILCGGIYSALKSYTGIQCFDQKTIFKLGTMISLIAVGSFTIFMLLYMNVFNRFFMAALEEQSTTKMYSSSYMVALTIIIEGLSAALATTYISTQYLNKNISKKSSY